MNMEKVYCYFHNDDMDGWASSAVVKMKHPNAEFHGYNYEPNLKLANGYDIVYMVDCSVPAKDMEYLIKHNKKFIWIDHHAKKILDICKELGGEIKGIRDTNSKNSACVLTWRYLFPDDEVPFILESIEDMDIWKWEQPMTDEINMTLFIDYKENRDRIMLLLGGSFELDKLIDRGKCYIKMRDNQIDYILETMQTKTFHGHKTGVVNSPVHQSHIGAEMLKRNPDIQISMIWYASGALIRVSLRTRGDIDVSEIAAKYGGGGHKPASGFELDISNPKGRSIFMNLIKGEMK